MRRLFAGAAVVAIVALLCFALQRQRNPPGFSADESSIAWNALTIARSGVDEYGTPHPLYFRAFGEYKNPIYIYLLAGVFRVVTPTNGAARTLSQFLGFAAAALLGLLAWRITRRDSVALITFATAALTPALFEPTRLVFEEAAYPLVLAAILVVAHAAFERLRVAHAVALAVLLALLTYTYSIGRLHALLLLGAFVVFAFRRDRIVPLAITIVLFGLLVLPIALFEHAHPDSITGRAEMISYIPGLRHDPAALITALEQHVLDNVAPLGYALTGDPQNRHHVRGSGGSILLMTLILAIAGAIRAWRGGAWWRFVIAGTLLSIIPASLMNERYHSLRLLPYAVFLIVLSIPAFELQRRTVIVVALVLGVLQLGWFFRVYTRDGHRRPLEFDAGFRPTLADAIRQPQRPICVAGLDQYVHAYWYGAQMGVQPSAFVVIGDKTPPPHALVIGYVHPCSECKVVSANDGVVAYLTP